MKLLPIGINGAIGSGKDSVAKLLIHLIEEQPLQSYGLPPHSFIDEIAMISYRNIILSEEYPKSNNFEVKRFADKLKDFVCSITGLTREQLEKKEVKEMPLEAFPNYYCYRGDNIPENVVFYSSSWEECRTYMTTHSYVRMSKRFLTPRQLMEMIGDDLIKRKINENVWINSFYSNFDTSKQSFIVPDLRYVEEAESLKKHNAFLIKVVSNVNYRDGSTRISSNSNHLSVTSLNDYTGFNYFIHNYNGLDDLISQIYRCKYAYYSWCIYINQKQTNNE